MSQSPSGIQIYLVTSFLFTLGQSTALRNNAFRAWVGLPLRTNKKEEATIAKEFLELKKLEKQAQEERGEDGEVLGKGVLVAGFETGRAGTRRPSTIELPEEVLEPAPRVQAPHLNVVSPQGPFIHGVSAPHPSQIPTTANQDKAPTETTKEPVRQYLEEGSEADMERANQGLAPITFAHEPARPQSPKTLTAKHKKHQNKKRKRKR